MPRLQRHLLDAGRPEMTSVRRPSPLRSTEDHEDEPNPIQSDPSTPNDAGQASSRKRKRGTGKAREAETNGYITQPQPPAVGIKPAVLEATFLFIPVMGMLSFIFGGCCLNVYALEALLSYEPHAGILLTFTQFIFVAIVALPSQISFSNPPLFLKPREIPLLRWCPYIALFFAVNILNNYAFGFKISVPVHIILRSGGSITTMGVGWLWGKRYASRHVFAVLLLTLGVLIAAVADAGAKGKIESNPEKSAQDLFTFIAGLGILFVAQVLSAIMGLYTQATYEKYGNHWQENLFYSHVLSLPLFAPFYSTILEQLKDFISSYPLVYVKSPRSVPSDDFKYGIPLRLVLTAANSVTQYACIRGVHMLAARTSALTVTIVLNVRKLVSLFLSIYLFGNYLPPGVVVGAFIVFVAGGIYSLESQRQATERQQAKAEARAQMHLGVNGKAKEN
ncbi:MAG: golgi uridine diphosphate-N- acetylglucosamine transporter [Vezdaea acicularis]|nr:MAG: golgi uridine diphosphate-N- acetylglucosamine transporter [Vezdaea acicularis]